MNSVHTNLHIELYRMRHLLNTEYATSSPSPSSCLNQSATSTISSILNEDFDFEEEENVDELDWYASEKLAKREVDVLAWWKVNNLSLMSLVELILMHD